MKIDILGTPYELLYSSQEKDEKLVQCDGYCDDTTKRLVVDDMRKGTTEVMSKGNLDEYRNCCARHEIIHAFFFESGLAHNSDFAANEENVDWIARQFPKMLRAFREAKVI